VPSTDAQVHAQDLAEQPEACASWLAKSLQGPRSTDTLELLLLDDEGSTCTWLTTSTASDDVVGALGRAGQVVETTDESARPAATPVEFFAPTPLESSVQALAGEQDFGARASDEQAASAMSGAGESKDTRAGAGGRLASLVASLSRGRKQGGGRKGSTGQGASKSGSSKQGAAQGTPRRVAVLATHDALARVMLDELDAQGVRVGGAATLWHAMCLAWDPRTTRALSAPIIAQQSDVLVQAGKAQPHEVVGIVTVLSEGRLVWAWSRQGELVAGSSQVLRMRTARDEEPIAIDGVQQRQSPAALVMLTSDDLARLLTDWLSWSAQLSVAPSQIVLVLPEQLATGPGALHGAEAAELLSQRWGVAHTDATQLPDPLGASLERCAKVLASTPRPSEAKRTQVLAALSQRPGRESRRLHAWAAAGIALLGVALGAFGARQLAAARKAEQATLAWRSSWQGKVKEVFPPASTPPPTITPLMLIEDEIRRREVTSTRPAGADAARPVVRELELLSLVLASPTVEVLSITLDSASVPVVEVLVPTTSEAEALLEGLRRIGGSTIASWSMDISSQGEKRRARLSGRWQERGATSGRGGA
jgi:hypothetical protein